MRSLNCCGFLTVLALVLGGLSCTRGPSDETIATQIKARFYADPLVKAADVWVAVQKGEVTLSGTAGSSEIELHAFQLAMGIPGVRKISDQIVVVAAGERPQKASLDPASPPRVIAGPARADYVPTLPPPPEEIRVIRVERPAAAPQQVEVNGDPAPAPEIPAVAAAAAPEPVVEARSWSSPDTYHPPLAEPPLNPRERERSKSREPVQLISAGANSTFSLYARWFGEFRGVERNVDIQFEPVGSSAGIGQLLERNIDFAVSDVAATDAALRRHPMLHFPAAIQGVAVICNIDYRPRELNLSGEVLAAIYMGVITTWDHPAIRALNPRAILPPASIITVHRSEAHATTALFTEFLAAHSPDWKARVHSGNSVNWPVHGLGAKGESGVLSLVAKTPSSIGYVDSYFAVPSNNTIVCALQNRGGRFVKPVPETLTAAGRTKEMPGDFRGSLVDTVTDKNAYPIAGFTWVITPSEGNDRHKKEALHSFLKWMLTTGQNVPDSMAFAQLPKELAAAVRSQLDKLH